MKMEETIAMQNSVCCKCFNESKKLNVVTQADNVAVASLPDSWIPKHAGPTLFKYLENTEKNHERVLESIKVEAAQVNKSIDSKIRDLAENLLEFLLQNQRDIDLVITSCKPGEGGLSKDEHSNALKDIHKLYNKYIDTLETFKVDASRLEIDRSDKIKIIFRKKFQNLIKVGLKAPKSLLHDFDECLYEFNQQILSNCRAYVELQAKLRPQANISMVRARSALNQLCLDVPMVYRNRSAIPWYRARKNTRERIYSADEKKRESTCKSIGNILESVEVLDVYVARLVQGYKTAVAEVVTGVIGKLNILEKSICHQYHISSKENCASETLDLQRLCDNTVRRVSTNTHRKHECSKLLTNLSPIETENISTSLTTLGACLRETYAILHDASHLWDAHMIRSAVAQKLTTAAVEDLCTKHDSLELCQEVAFNISLEQLRCCSDPDKLHQLYDTVVLILDRSADLFQQHKEGEDACLREFLKFPDFMAKILVSEFYCFLRKYRCVRQSSSDTPKPSTTVIDSPVALAILQTELQEISLRNWRNGFLEAFEYNVSLVPEELKRQAFLWVQERNGTILLRNSLKSMSHSIRLERIASAREERLSELSLHQARLDSHLDAIYKMIENLPLQVAEYCSLESPELNPIMQWIDKLCMDSNILVTNDSLNPDVRKLKMKSYGSRLNKYRTQFQESLEHCVERYKMFLQHRVQEARVANVRFMSQISLFHEGGRYCAAEATKTCNSLVKASESLEICLNKTKDVLSQRRSQILSMLDQKLLPLQKIFDETLKTGSRGVPDKKRPVNNKKK